MVIVQQGPLLVMLPSVTHVVLGERNKNMVSKDGAAERGECEDRGNNNRLWRGDKLRNKECMHGRERERGSQTDGKEGRSHC